jgi:hypothetical protein
VGAKRNETLLPRESPLHFEHLYCVVGRYFFMKVVILENKYKAVEI